MNKILVTLIVVALSATIDVASQTRSKSKTGGFGLPKPSGVIPAPKDVTPPEIDIFEPPMLATRGIQTKADPTPFKTTSSSIRIRGVARDSSGVAVVQINAQEARLSLTKEGTEFVGDALLVLGKNPVEVRAVDRFGNAAVLNLPVFREHEPVVEAKRIPKDLFTGQRWAVVVGVSDYKDPNIPDLRYADRDARAFADLLTTPLEQGGAGISKANVRTLVNEQATSNSVREALNEFLKGAIDDDIVMIYFAGHGAPDPDRPKVLYLLTHDSDLGKLGSTSIKMQEIQDALRDYVAAKTVLVFADACHSRGVGTVATRALASPDLINQFLTELGRARASTLTFSASDANQLSQEDKKWGTGHGVFTYYLLQGLRGKADTDSDRIVRLGELIFYVNDNVRRETKAQQSPISSGAFDVNLPLTVVAGPK